MYNNYDYPYGADGPNAPWNEDKVPEKDFEVVCSQSLSRNTVICTDDYNPVYDSGYDDGVSYYEYYSDTSDTDWKASYENCAMTPIELIEACKVLAKHLMDEGITKVENLHLGYLIDECEGWTVDEYDIEQV